jgi:uncharacterized protein YaaQ
MWHNKWPRVQSSYTTSDQEFKVPTHGAVGYWLSSKITGSFFRSVVSYLIHVASCAALASTLGVERATQVCFSSWLPSIFGTAAFASRAVTNLLKESGKLANRWTTQSSSEIKSPTSYNPFMISVIAWMWSCTEWGAVSRASITIAACWPMSSFEVGLQVSSTHPHIYWVFDLK